jgi:hypothetical protein
VARVDIIKDGKVIYSAEPQTRDVSFVFSDRATVRGRHYYYVRLAQADRMLAWSSPFFVDYR